MEIIYWKENYKIGNYLLTPGKESTYYNKVNKRKY